MIIITSPQEKLAGELTIPGDKSITHRAIMLGALARGITEIRGYLDAADCWSTVECLRALGVRITLKGRRLFIEGRNKKFMKPPGELDAGNSGTTARMLLGILAGQDFQVTLSGDLSLQKRPMDRVIEPLQLMGAHFEGESDTLPVTIRGGLLKGVTYECPLASAQVKSAVLLAGLQADGTTVFEEPERSRNHTELMLSRFGARIEVEGNRITLQGGTTLRGGQVWVPGDISAAAFLMVAAAIIPGSEVLIKNVGVNPTRSGAIDLLTKMGATIELREEKMWGKEPVADVMINGGSGLKGVKIGGEMIPRLIDEIPALAVAAAVAEGETVISDASELKVKESDRIAALAGQLRKLGAQIEETEEGMIIQGGADLKGAALDSCGDHRLAMALAVAGLVAEGETSVSGAEVINISFPGFMQSLRSLLDK